MTITITPHAIAMFLMVCVYFWVLTTKARGRIIGIVLAILCAIGTEVLLSRAWNMVQ